MPQRDDDDDEDNSNDNNYDDSKRNSSYCEVNLIELVQNSVLWLAFV